jgi:hypothetical protein
LSLWLRYDDLQLQRTLMDIPEYIACKRGKNLCSWGQLHMPKGVWLHQKRTTCEYNELTCFFQIHNQEWCAPSVNSSAASVANLLGMKAKRALSINSCRLMGNRTNTRGSTAKDVPEADVEHQRKSSKTATRWRVRTVNSKSPTLHGLLLIRTD